MSFSFTAFLCQLHFTHTMKGLRLLHRIKYDLCLSMRKDTRSLWFHQIWVRYKKTNNHCSVIWLSLQSAPAQVIRFAEGIRKERAHWDYAVTDADIFILFSVQEPLNAQWVATNRAGVNLIVGDFSRGRRCTALLIIHFDTTNKAREVAIDAC